MARVRRASLFPALRRSGEDAHRWLDEMLTLLGLAVAIHAFLKKATWPEWHELEIGWELKAGLGGLLLWLLLRWAIRWELRRKDTVALKARKTTAGPGDVELRLKVLETEDEVRELARFIEEAYPHAYVSRVNALEREEVFLRWLAECPGFAQTLVEMDQNGGETTVAFTVMVRTDHETYVGYRNGENDPWTWNCSHLVQREAMGISYMFVQALYGVRSAGMERGKALHELFLNHVQALCPDPRSFPPVLYAPTRQQQSAKNYAWLGFEQARKSRGKYAIWELDCRRVGELARAAQRTYAAVCEEPARDGVKGYRIRPMTLDDYAGVHRLWLDEGLVLRDSDDRELIGCYLERNPQLSLVTESEVGLEGVLLCGHDGRAGYIHHIAVRDEAQRHGLGQAMLEEAVHQLERRGMSRSHAFVVKENAKGMSFWRKVGWKEREDLQLFTYDQKKRRSLEGS